MRLPAQLQSARSSNTPSSLGLSCQPTGVSLAGAPLLRRTTTGFAPRPRGEIDTLMKAAYGQQADSEPISRRLGVVADALNRGDLGRAMVGAVRLRLPELSWDRAVRIARAEDALAKYNFNPDEPRDSRGRWTSGGATTAPKAPMTPGGPTSSPPSSSPPVHLFGGRLIHTGGGSNGPPIDEPPSEEPGLDPIPDVGVRAPLGWDTPGYTYNGIYYPPTRKPTFPDGRPWPTADPDTVLKILDEQKGFNPKMIIYVPIDKLGPILIGSTATAEIGRTPEGYSEVELEGLPQRTTSGGIATNHARESVVRALIEAESDQFSKIYFNRSFTTITNGDVVSYLRADLLCVYRIESISGIRYKPIEILSPGQYLSERTMQMMGLPYIESPTGYKYKALLDYIWNKIAKIRDILKCL